MVLLVVVALVAAVGVGAAAAKLTGRGLFGDDSAEKTTIAAKSDAACTKETSLAVVVAPEMASVVKAAAERAVKADPCVGYDVEAISPATVADRITAKKQLPQVWLPDSVTWVDTLPAEIASGWVPASTDIARSPVLLAAPTTGKYAGAPRPASWATLINVEGEIRMVNPDVESTGRLVFDSSRAAAPGALNLAVAERLIFMSRFAGESTPTLLDGALRYPDYKPFPVSEQVLSTWTKEHPGVLDPVMPVDATPTLDYPWIPAPGLASAESSAAATLLKALTDETGRKDLRTAGFRAPDGSGGPTIEGFAPTPYKETALQSPKDRLASLEQWDVLRKDMRMLAVIDVSGSMKWPAVGGSGVSRVTVTEDAAVTALEILPPASKIGAWVFSTQLDGPAKHWKELSPVAPLEQEEGTATHRDALIAVTHQLPNLLTGDTALYDTTLAALKMMTDTYDPEYVNSVVLMTDGVNDNPLGGLTLDQLLAEIATTYDPKRPVRVVTIGMGEADATALQAISAATGGTSYIAHSADDIKRVFVEALLARRAEVINPAK